MTRIFRFTGAARGLSLLTVLLASCIGDGTELPEEIGENEAAVVHGDPFLPLPDFGAVGMLRRKGATDGVCSLTLIHPRVAMTAAHCFKQLGQLCETEAQAKDRLEVVISSPGDEAHLTPFGINRIALAPGAFPSQISSCPATPYYTCDNDYIKQTVDPSRDVALILLDGAVPSSLATPIPPITSISDNIDADHTKHVNLASESSFANQTAWVVGWGVADSCGIGRNAGQMGFEGGPFDYAGADWSWNRSCVYSIGCDGELFRYGPGACGEYGKWTDFITMHRTQSSPGVFDGATVGAGDSGGALVLLGQHGGSALMYQLGVISQGSASAWCGHPLDNYDFTAGFAATFGADTGPFIEKQLSSWIVKKPAPVPVPRPIPRTVF